ncbi:MAG: HlyC/CorC family transporter [Dehalococcoidia bacterium]|nr:HlyC/CorC family transporter [Dehalococcoidia bacterium]
MEVALLLVLILLNGVFAMSEIALVTARRGRLQALIEQGDPGAAAAVRLGEEPTRFLSTIQIGITSIGILNGIVGEAVFARPFAEWLHGLGLDERISGYFATGLVVVVVTYLSIVLGELVPKRLGQIRAESIARFVARPMQGLATVSKPFVRLLSGSTDLLLKLIGMHGKTAPTVTEEEIHALLEEGSDVGVIEDQEHRMVRNVFRLDDRQIASLMVPRGEIVFLDVERPLEENLERIEGAQHTRFPVCRGGLRDVMGVMSAKQLLNQTLRGQTPDFGSNLSPAVFVPESLTGMELLQNFRSSNAQLVLVIDEYGEVQGMVTLRDVIEAITGEFHPHDVEDAWAVQREDGSWLIDGLIPIPELKDRLDMKTAPEEERGRYNTLSGMVMLLLGRVPHTADAVDWESWRFEIVDMDGKRIDKVLASQRPAPPAVPADEPAGEDPPPAR